MGLEITEKITDTRYDGSMIPGYFVATDAHGDSTIWRERGDYPVPVLLERDLREAPELWDALVTSVGSGA